MMQGIKEVAILVTVAIAVFSVFYGVMYVSGGLV